MSLQLAAQHLASHGRGDDKVLVHMTPREVKSLNELAMAHGGHLTINPKTGLPEAGFLSAILPTVAGLALNAAFPGLGALATAGIVGGGSYLLRPEKGLMGGLMAGLGAYGGANLASGLGAAATSEAGATAANQATAAAEVAEKQALAQNATALQQQQTALNAGYGSMDPGMVKPLTASQLETVRMGAVDSLPSSVNDISKVTGLNSIPSGVSALGSEAGRTGFMNQFGSGMELAKTAGMAAAPAIYEEMSKKKDVPELKGDADMGQRYAFDPGYDSSLPGRTGAPKYVAISNEEAKKRFGFADGGEIQYPTGESVIRMATGGDAAAAPAAAAPAQAGLSGYGAYTPADANVAAYGLGTGIDYSGYNTMPNQGIGAALPKSNPNQKIVDLYKKVEADEKAAAAKKAAEEAAAAPPAVETGGQAAGGLMQSYAQGGDTNAYRVTMDDTLEAAYAKAQENNDTAKMREIEREMELRNTNKALMSKGLSGIKGLRSGGVSNLGDYSDGGRLLRGPGDGISDSIPAVIGRKQPARLADGEFVVPARIVSELGNGSTEAGARKLYAMMDRVQSARKKTVGKGKIAHNSRSDKFLPA